jgi:hypothetical protein
MDRHWIIRTSYPAKLPEGGEAFPHPQFFAHVHCPHMQRLIQRGVSPLVVTEHDGKFTEGWADFELKGGNVMRIMGIGVRQRGHAAPDAASCLNSL